MKTSCARIAFLSSVKEHDSVIFDKSLPKYDYKSPHSIMLKYIGCKLLKLPNDMLCILRTLLSWNYISVRRTISTVQSTIIIVRHNYSLAFARLKRIWSSNVTFFIPLWRKIHGLKKKCHMEMVVIFFFFINNIYNFILNNRYWLIAWTICKYKIKTQNFSFIGPYECMR